jgi:beta-glucosidase
MADSHAVSERPSRFPDGFLWGAATSSHQVEGDNVDNDWWDWEQVPGHVVDGTRSGAAAMWWDGRAEDDLARAAELGHNAHRFGLEWSRLEPSPGVFDLTAFARYRAIFEHARALGMSIMVTLNHFTLPRWAAESGSWLARETVERFAAFASRCASTLGDVVDRWATLNEPNVLALMGYAGDRWPPGLGQVGAFARALANMMRAHAAGYRAVHEVLPDASVGIVLSLPSFVGARPRRSDATAAAGQDWIFNGVVLAALDRGRLLPPLALGPKRIDGLARSFDWIGVNYYGRYHVQFDPSAPQRAFGRHIDVGNVKTETNDWGAPHPAGLTEQLVRLSRFAVPLFVTENGVYDNDDRVRPGYLVEHVRAVHAAIESGADVRGYFHWSLIDNFEWAEGWSTRFGLIGLDPGTQERTVRGSASVFARICRANGVEGV